MTGMNTGGTQHATERASRRKAVRQPANRWPGGTQSPAARPWSDGTDAGAHTSRESVSGVCAVLHLAAPPNPRWSASGGLCILGAHIIGGRRALWHPNILHCLMIRARGVSVLAMNSSETTHCPTCLIRMPHGHRVPAMTPVALTDSERALWEKVKPLPLA
ncbi:hypothetical protein JCM12141A_60870 [Mycolicibacterium hodleri]